MATFEILAANNGDSSSVVGYPEGTKMYVALLNQTGTDAPVATVLVNTLGGTVVWTRDGGGIYYGTLVGAFTANKTAIIIGASFSGALAYGSRRESADAIIVNTSESGSDSDSVLDNTTIQIIVFP